jgi:16S rRNA (guanine(966)-N(2))-methyltransferase RsmD
MRVVGGTFKGRQLASFRGRSIRPTSDKVREAVFDLLGSRGGRGFESVLDLFAGTGAMGIEALSRGALRACFVDNDARAVSIIKKNLEACGIEVAGRGTPAKVFKRDVHSMIRSLSGSGERFDLIFIDPPYNSSLTEDVLKGPALVRLLSPGGFVVAETSRRTPALGADEGLEPVCERRYGDTLVYIFKRP